MFKLFLNPIFLAFLSISTTAHLAQAEEYGLGALADPSPPKSLSAALRANEFTTQAALPAVKDNRSLFGPVKSQGSCGSCVIFAAQGLLESAIVREYGMPSSNVILAEQLTLECAAETAPKLCQEGSSVPWILNILKDRGATNSNDPEFKYIANTRCSTFQAISPSNWRSERPSSRFTKIARV